MPSGRRKCASMGNIFEVSAENVKTADCLADDAVRFELLSASNSLIVRENTGDFAIFGVI
jgi:hypothetical protein